MNKPSADSGGSSTFLSSLAAELKKQGGDIVFEDVGDHFDKEDVLLLNSWVTAYEKALPYWRKSLPVLLRLDGAARDYGRFDDADRVQGQIAALADEIVFQSEYCRRRLVDRWDIVHKNGRIIYNGVDTAVFSPDGQKRSLPGAIRAAYVSHSTNFLKGFRHLVHLARKLSHVTFIACIPPHNTGWPDEALGAMPPPANLLLLGRVPREDLPALLRGCDLFVFPSINDSCSSAVLEAMSCGLPIWYHPSGGTPELVGDAGIPFSEKSESDVEHLLEHRSEYSRRAQERAKRHFDMGHTARQYVEAARELLTRRRGVVQRVYRRVAPPPLAGGNTYGLPKLTIGYYLPCDLAEYEKVPASVWIRCFQLIHPLSEKGISVLINPGSNEAIDLGVILRLENERGVETAHMLKQKGIPYVFDMVVNYFDLVSLPYDSSLSVTDEQRTCTLRILEGATVVTTVSPWLADRASSFHPRTICIPDAVPDSFFDVRKEPSDFNRSPLRVCYVGYAVKSKDLQDWLPILKEQHIEITVISEQPPPDEALPGIQWKKWIFEGLAGEIARHEIGLAPRVDLSSPYNLGHSSFKIASLMACGLPVLASPVPSYAALLGDGTAGKIARNASEFADALKAMVSDRDALGSMSMQARLRAGDLAVSHVAQDTARTLRQAVAIAEGLKTAGPAAR